ncbi:MAG TPA: DPP IV N-terminal domain-containing protein [Phycisphaerales bacterium]|nr:DPP IV N-terminal domain-containing protein [Phycisphaerales bacterium]
MAPHRLLLTIAALPAVAVLPACGGGRAHQARPTSQPAKAPGTQVALPAVRGPLAGDPTSDAPPLTLGQLAAMERVTGAPHPADPIYGSTPATHAPRSEPAPPPAHGLESLSQVTFVTEGAAMDPCVSRDGQWLVFAGTQHRPTADIYIKPVTGRAVTQLTSDPAHDVMPAISPDGTRIAFASNRAGSWDIFVMPVRGGQAAQVTSDEADELHPSWSPDGTRLVFCRLGQTSGRWEMWVTGAGSDAAASEFIGYGLLPHWCPATGTGSDGRDRILFQRGRERGDRAFSVWTIDYKPGDAGSPTELFGQRGIAAINPAWSGDGKQIVFATVPAWPGPEGETAAVSSELWIADASGSGRVGLVSGPCASLMPTWGGDGRVYFASDRGGNQNIWSLGTEKALAALSGAGPQQAAVPEPAH